VGNGILKCYYAIMLYINAFQHLQKMSSRIKSVKYVIENQFNMVGRESRSLRCIDHRQWSSHRTGWGWLSADQDQIFREFVLHLHVNVYQRLWWAQRLNHRSETQPSQIQTILSSIHDHTADPCRSLQGALETPMLLFMHASSVRHASNNIRLRYFFISWALSQHQLGLRCRCRAWLTDPWFRPPSSTRTVLPAH